MNLLTRFLVLGVVIGFMSLTMHAQTPVDPTPILRGGGGSQAIIGQTFTGALLPGDTTGLNYENMTGETFIAINLVFFGDPSLVYSCYTGVDPLLVDPFFNNCQVNGNHVLFSGLDPNHPGIGPANPHFNIFLQDLTLPVSFDGTAFVSSTPEPEAALLFLTGLGAIAGFLKRRSNSVEAS
jgi:hypothetical protein